MATNAKNIAELLNTDTTVAVGDIADDSVTSAKLDTNIAIDGTLTVDTMQTRTGSNALNITNNETNSAAHIALNVSGGTRMHIDTVGNTGIGSVAPSTYATNTKVMQITTNGNDAGVGASIRQTPWTSYQGRGYKHSEVFALSNITSSTQISQLQGTGANGFRCLFEYIVTGHTSGIGNAHFWGKYYWDGGTGAPVLIQADYEENATLQITFDTTVSNRLQLFLASHNATNGFNGIAEVTYWVPIDFANSNYTTS